MNAYDCVQAARSTGRPTALKYIHALTDTFLEMHGDRRFGDDPAIVAGVGDIGGMPVTIIGIARGQIDRANKLCAFCKATDGKVIVDSFLGDEQASNLMIRLVGDRRELERRRTGPVLGAHLGKGCIGVAYIE